jgi:pimeloyl-ACP methyl ester carboxylesterase
MDQQPGPIGQRPPADLDPDRFEVHRYSGRGFSQAYVRENPGGVPLVLVHGWPETKRIYWRVIEPLAAAGFEVIVPDLRGFGDSEVGPTRVVDTPVHALDLAALLVEGLGHERVVLAGGDLGGPVVQELALRFPDLVDRMVLFNCPVPGMGRSEGGHVWSSSTDYFVRQGTDADGLMSDLATPRARTQYVSTFYTSRFWAHDGAFDPAAVAFHVEPFSSAEHLRAGFSVYEAVFDRSARSEPSALGPNPDVPVLILYGPSDHVLPTTFDLDAAAAFDRHVGPFRLRDCGHFVPWEAPHAFSSGTVSFCSDLLR